MISLTDITRQDDAIKLFKPWWELLKEYLIYAMLFVTVVINGFKLSQEKFICMPATEGNGTCRYMDNVSHSSCFVVEEIESAAFSEYISLGCAQQMDLFAKYFDLLLLIFPLFIYILGAVFYNIPLILYKFKDINNTIIHCNDDEVKALVTKLDIYFDNEISKRRTGKYNKDENTLNKALDLQSAIQSAVKNGIYSKSNVLRVGPQGEEYHNVPTEAESNTLSSLEEEVRDIPVPRKSRWFRFVYIIYTFLQLTTFVGYIVTIVLSWNVLVHETKCVLKETYRYKYDFFLCRHSLWRIYQHLSFLLLFLSVIFIFLILTQSYLLINGYRTNIRKLLNSAVIDITGDQRFIMTFMYYCKKGYLKNFCRLFNKEFYMKINRYIADCRYPIDFLDQCRTAYHHNINLDNISALPFCITSFHYIDLLEITKSDLSMKGTFSPLKNLNHLRQLVLNFCKIQIFDVGSLPDGIILLDILSNPLKEVIGRCPESLNLCSLDQNGCSMKWNNFENIVVLGKKFLRRNMPVNWESIYSYLVLKGREQFKHLSGEIHIFNNEVNIDGSGKITNVKESSDNIGAIKDMVFLKGIFSLLHFQVHLHGAEDITNYINDCGKKFPWTCPSELFFVFMGDVKNSELNIPSAGKIKITELIAKFPRLEYTTPVVSISLMKDTAQNFSPLNLQISHWNIFYASVPQRLFRDNMISYLNSEHEDDFASTISGWEDAKIQNFLYRKFYLLPVVDTRILTSWESKCREEEGRLSRLKIAIDRHYLGANIEDEVTSMADINAISALQNSVGRIKLVGRQITCCMITTNCILVAYPDIGSLITEFQEANPLCVEFKTGKDLKTFYLEHNFPQPNYELDVMCINLKEGQANIPEPVVLDSIPIRGQAFVMGYSEKLDSDLIVESHCQVYKEQSCSREELYARNPNCQPQGATTREYQSLLERDIDDVQKLWKMEFKQVNQNYDYEMLLQKFKENSIYVIRLPAKFTEVCRSALVVCLLDHHRPCVKAFYNNRYPEEIYSPNNSHRPRELLFQSAVKSSNVREYVPEFKE